MSLIARLLGLFILVGLTMPIVLSAQEKKDKKPAAKKGVKDDAKSDAADDDKAEKKKKDAGDDEKPEPKKKKEPEEKLVYGQIITAKMKKVEANSNKDFTIEMPVIDPMKVYDLQVWKAGQLQSIAQSQNPQDYANRTASYQRELFRRQNNIYSPKDFDLRGSENVKVRSLYPPIEYDDRGFLKKWTKKELAALKAENKSLPGYPSAMENLRAGQTVQVYMAKTAKTFPKQGKKKLEDDDAAFDRPEAVMIVITQEVGPGGN